MNFIKKIGNLFSKMTSLRKSEKLVEVLVEKPRQREDLKVKDIEDLVKSQLSARETRSARLKRTQAKAPLVASANVENKQIPLLKLDSLMSTNPDLMPRVSPQDQKIAGDFKPSRPVNSKTSKQVDRAMELGLSVVTVQNKLKLASNDGEGPSIKINTKAISRGNVKKANRLLPVVKTEGVPQTALVPVDAIMPKGKSKAKTKKLAKPKKVTNDVEKEKPVAKKRTTKKQAKETNQTEVKKEPLSETEDADRSSVLAQEPTPTEPEPLKSPEKKLDLTPFMFNAHQIQSNVQQLEVTGNFSEVKKEPKKKRSSLSKSEKLSDSEPEIKLEKWEPDNWREALENIRIMRTMDKAPVDQMGCHKCSDERADEKTKRFQHLVALMLSSQTRDQITYEVMQRLKENTCTPAGLANMDLEKLTEILHPVSFYRNKAKFIQKTAKILMEKYDSDIPNNINDLIKLPGVGPKMAHICMSVAWDITTGIGVDTHVHRLSNRLGWVKSPTKEPEQTRKQLELWLPEEHWREVNHLLVGFGQTISFAMLASPKRAVKKKKQEVSPL